MKILFVFPGFEHYPVKNKTTIVDRLDPAIPLAFGILASLTPDNHTIEFIDERVKQIDFNKKYDLVGITTIYTMNVPNAYRIADEFRRRGVTVVLGGAHSSSMPLEAKQHADAVVVGEAEEIWPQLLKDFEKGSLKHFYRQTKPVDVRNIPIPFRFPNSIKSSIISSGIVQATRGCPNGCEYCDLTNRKYGKIYRMRPIENVIEEIKSLPNKFISFNDNSLTINPKYSKELFKEMRSLNKKFYCNGNINTLGKDDELLKMARKAGCQIWHVGLESVSQETINLIGKTTNKVREYKKAIKKIHDYGMLVNAHFIFGFDTDTKDVFAITRDMVKDLNIDISAFTVLTPLPGTPLYYRLEKENRILTRDWTKYDFRNAVFKPKNMTPKQLEMGVLGVKKFFNSPLNVVESVAKTLKYGLYPSLITGMKYWLERIDE